MLKDINLVDSKPTWIISHIFQRVFKNPKFGPIPYKRKSFYFKSNVRFFWSKYIYICEIGHVTIVQPEVYAVCWKAYKTSCTKISKKAFCIPPKRVFSLSLPTWEVFNFRIVWRGQLPLQAVRKQTFLFVCMLIHTYMSRRHGDVHIPLNMTIHILS